MDATHVGTSCWRAIVVHSKACWLDRERLMGALVDKLLGVVLAVVGGLTLGGIALHRQEPVNSLWLVVASVCVYLLGYRFYAAWIAARIWLINARDPGRTSQ